MKLNVFIFKIFNLKRLYGRLPDSPRDLVQMYGGSECDPETPRITEKSSVFAVFEGGIVFSVAEDIYLSEKTSNIKTFVSGLS